MQHVINIIHSLPPNSLTTLLALLGGGGGIAVVLQAIKHFTGLTAAEDKKIITVILSILSTAPAVASWYISNSNQNPLPFIGQHAAFLMTFAVIVHRFAVSPSYYKLVDFLSGVFAKQTAYQQAKADVPVTSAPAAPVEPSGRLFTLGA